MDQLNDNLAVMTDSYKAGHFRQYPAGTTSIMSYFESRGGLPYTVFFGLQYIIKKHLLGRVMTQKKLTAAQIFWNEHFGDNQPCGEDIFNHKGWQHIIDNHDGHLPIRIRAVPEGTKVPSSNALITVENTDPECFWLTNWLETLLVQVW